LLRAQEARSHKNGDDGHHAEDEDTQRHRQAVPADRHRLAGEVPVAHSDLKEIKKLLGK